MKLTAFLLAVIAVLILWIVLRPVGVGACPEQMVDSTAMHDLARMTHERDSLRLSMRLAVGRWNTRTVTIVNRDTVRIVESAGDTTKQSTDIVKTIEHIDTLVMHDSIASRTRSINQKFGMDAWIGSDYTLGLSASYRITGPIWISMGIDADARNRSVEGFRAGLGFRF